MSKEVMRQALDVLKYVDTQDNDRDFLLVSELELLDNAITALRKALAEQPQQDDAWKAEQKTLADEAVKCATEALANPSHPATMAAREYYGAAQQQEPVGTYSEIFESMRALLRSGRQADQQIYMAMQDKPLYASPQPAQQELKQDLLYSTVAMQEREAQRIDRIVGGIERVKQERLAKIAATAPLAEQPAQQNVVAWESDRGEIYYDKEDAYRYSDGFIRPLVYGDTPPAQQEQEPVAWMTKDGEIYKHECWPEYEARPLVFGDTSQPAQRTWVGLTQEERDHIWDTVGNSDAHGDVDGWSGRDVMSAIEAKLKEKNT